MKKSALKTILGVLFVLVAAYGVLAYLDQGLDEGTPAGGPLERELARVNPDSLHSVTMLQGPDTLRLRRQGGRWHIDEHLADSAVVDSLRAALRGAEVSSLASRNPENHARLGVAGDAARTAVIAAPEGDTARLVVGGAGPYAGSGFVRLPGSDEVHVVRGDLPKLLRRPEDGWRNRLIARVDTARLSVLRARRGGDRYALRKGDDAWTLEGRPVEDGRLASILSRLHRLRSSDFAADSVRIADPDRTLTALTAEGDTLAHLLLEEEPGSRKHRVTTPDADAVWLLSRYEADQLVPSRDELAGRGEPVR